MTFANGPFTPDMNDGRHVFVFGSNLAGRHGAGAALEAHQHWGVQSGPRGARFRTGHAYAIATKDEQLKTLDLETIRKHVNQFLAHAMSYEDVTFLVTAIGTGLAGYSHEQIAPMFMGAPYNCILPKEWESILAYKSSN